MTDAPCDHLPWKRTDGPFGSPGLLYNTYQCGKGCGATKDYDGVHEPVPPMAEATVTLYEVFKPCPHCGGRVDFAYVPEQCKHGYLRGDSPDSDEHNICVQCGEVVDHLHVIDEVGPAPSIPVDVEAVARKLVDQITLAAVDEYRMEYAVAALKAQRQAGEREADAAEHALDDIAAACGCPKWDYPGQVVRDVVVAVMGAEKGMEWLRKRPSTREPTESKP